MLPCAFHFKYQNMSDRICWPFFNIGYLYVHTNMYTQICTHKYIYTDIFTQKYIHIHIYTPMYQWWFPLPFVADLNLSFAGLVAIGESLGLKLLPPRKKINVMLMGNHSAGKSSFINWWVSNPVYIFLLTTFQTERVKLMRRALAVSARGSICQVMVMISRSGFYVYVRVPIFYFPLLNTFRF